MTDIYNTDELVQQLSPLMDDINKVLIKIPGVVQVGLTHSYVTGIGDEYQVLVYIKDESVISLLPNSIYGMRIVWSVVGEINVTAFVETAEEYERRIKKEQELGSLGSKIQSMQKGKYRPVVGGVSGGLFAAVKSTGTIGCIAKDGTGRTVLISNNHVFAYDIGTIPYKGVKGDPIIQPGSADGGTINDKVATLEKWIPVTLTGNIVDVAYAIPVVGTNTPNLCNLYSGSSADPVIGMTLSKGGRTTGCVSGIVESIKVTSNVTYTIKTSTGDIIYKAQFDDCISVRGTIPVALGGDSGSIWVTPSGNNVVGLTFAGNAAGDMAVAGKAKNVERLLGVVFGDGGGGGGDGGGCSSPTVSLTISSGGGDGGGGGGGGMKFTCKNLLDSSGKVIAKYCGFDTNGQYTSIIDCMNVCK